MNGMMSHLIGKQAKRSGECELAQGTYNDDYQPGALGPDGSFYRSVIGGLVRFKDRV